MKTSRLLNILRGIETEDNIQDTRFPIPESREKNIWEKITRKNINFRISKKGTWKQKLKFSTEKFKKGLEVKESQDKINVVHIRSNGDIDLIPAFHSTRTINYKADKPYRKKFNYAKRISIHYFDGTSEEGLLCDEFSPDNFKVNPSIEKTAIHSKIEFDNAYDTFEKDLIRTTAFTYSDKQIKMYIIFILTGIGLASLLWVGAYVILFLQ